MGRAHGPLDGAGGVHFDTISVHLCHIKALASGNQQLCGVSLVAACRDSHEQMRMHEVNVHGRGSRKIRMFTLQCGATLCSVMNILG